MRAVLGAYFKLTQIKIMQNMESSLFTCNLPQRAFTPYAVPILQTQKGPPPEIASERAKYWNKVSKASQI